MKKKINYRIGIIFLVLLLVLILGIFWFFFKTNHYSIYQIYTHDSVAGLAFGSPVEYHGVDVGTVKTITLINPHLVNILLSIKKNTPITKGTVATITTRGLSSRGFTGYVFISLEETGNDVRPLIAQPKKSYPIIPALSLKLETVDTTLSQINKNIELDTQLLHSVLDKNTIRSLQEMIVNLQQVTRMLAINNKKLNSILVNMSAASQHFEPLLKSSNQVMLTIDTQLLPKAYNSLNDLDNLTDNLSNLITTINQNPSILIHGVAPPKPGPGESR